MPVTLFHYRGARREAPRPRPAPVDPTDTPTAPHRDARGRFASRSADTSPAGENDPSVLEPGDTSPGAHADASGA